MTTPPPPEAAARWPGLLHPERDDNLIGRLYNWKFSSAAGLLREDHPEDVREQVATLARLFGNVGWLDGDIAVLIAATVRGLIGDQDEDDEPAATSG